MSRRSPEDSLPDRLRRTHPSYSSGHDQLRTAPQRQRIQHLQDRKHVFDWPTAGVSRNVHSFIHSFIHPFIHSFIHSFIYSFIHSFDSHFWGVVKHSFIHSLIHSCIHLFIHSIIKFKGPIDRCKILLDRIAHTTAFVTPVMKHWLEQEIAQWVHPTTHQRVRSDDPSHHEQMHYHGATSRSSNLQYPEWKSKIP